MVTFVIFWSAAFAIIFFVLGIIFKALASACNALLSSIGGVLAVGGLASLAGVVLYLLYVIIDGIIKDGFWSVVGSIIIFLVILGFIGGIIGGLGAVLLELVVVIVSFVFEIISGILEWLASTCEKGYAKFLTAIIKRLDKC